MIDNIHFVAHVENEQKSGFGKHVTRTYTYTHYRDEPLTTLPTTRNLERKRKIFETTGTK